MKRFFAGILALSSAMAQQPVYEDARVRIGVDPSSKSSAGLHFASPSVITYFERNQVRIELLTRQTNPRNVCFEVLQGEYLHCHEPGSEWLGANLQIQFETDQTRFGILQIAPNATLAIPPADVPPLLIALEGTDAEAVTRANGASAASGAHRTVKAADVLRWSADQVGEIQNTGKSAARFLVVEFGGPGE
jgi:hypothetical protein